MSHELPKTWGELEDWVRSYVDPNMNKKLDPFYPAADKLEQPPSHTPVLLVRTYFSDGLDIGAVYCLDNKLMLIAVFEFSASGAAAAEAHPHLPFFKDEASFGDFHYPVKDPHLIQQCIALGLDTA